MPSVTFHCLHPPSSLSDISKSVTKYLHDEQPLYRVLAIDLCARGFETWQHYVDVLEMLRALFSLSTYVKKDGISTLNVGSYARSAVLQIASSHTPLFMSTLTVDIMHSHGVEHRKSIMQVIAFLIRKVGEGIVDLFRYCSPRCRNR
jgi:WD repeat-containing protein 7